MVGFIDGGSGRAQPRDAKGEARDGNDGDAGIDNAADLFRVGRWMVVACPWS